MPERTTDWNCPIDVYIVWSVSNSWWGVNQWCKVMRYILVKYSTVLRTQIPWIIVYYRQMLASKAEGRPNTESRDVLKYNRTAPVCESERQCSSAMWYSASLPNPIMYHSATQPAAREACLCGPSWSCQQKNIYICQLSIWTNHFIFSFSPKPLEIFFVFFCYCVCSKRRYFCSIRFGLTEGNVAFFLFP